MEMAAASSRLAVLSSARLRTALTIKAILMEAPGRRARPGAGIQQSKAGTAGFGAK
jgi:hypothetical protein